MSEQADHIDVDAPDLTSITEARQSRAPLTTLAALAVVIAAAAGFFALSQSDDAEISEIAAGQADADGDAGTSTESAEDAPSLEDPEFTPISFTDITSENSPGNGRVFSDDGVYFVLSTAPGRVTFGPNTTSEEYMEAYRADTLYVYTAESGWQIQDAGDRFIADMTIDNGVLYAVSTGSKTEDVAAFGTSSDRGQTWNWNAIDDAPEIDNLTLFADGDDGPVLYASRWGYPDYNEVLQAAKAAGFNVNETTLQGFDNQGFSYIETDPDDPCALVRAQYLPEIADFGSWIAQASEEEQESARPEFDSMISWMKEEIANTDCEWDDAWLTEFSDGSALEEFEWPEPTRVQWSDIDFTVPEGWIPWATVYTFDGENFTDRGVPFPTDGGLEMGGAFISNDRLTVSVWDPTIMNGDRGFETEEAYEAAMSEAETIWSTSNGIDWTEENRSSLNDAPRYYDESRYYEPVAGNHRFQLSWEAVEQFWAEQDRRYAEEEAVDTPATTIEVTDDGEAPVPTTVPTTVLVGPDEADVEYYEEPAPDLQRSIAGGPWETVTVADLDPSIDVGDLVLREVRGSSLGVFLVYGPQYGPDGPPESRQLLVFSNNGVDWQTHELETDSFDFYGSDNGNGEIMAFSNRWNYEAPNQQSETRTILISADD
jgi:hypothetical protein